MSETLDIVPLLLSEHDEPARVVDAAMSDLDSKTLEVLRESGTYPVVAGYLAECMLADISVSPLTAIAATGIWTRLEPVARSKDLLLLNEDDIKQLSIFANQDMPLVA